MNILCSQDSNGCHQDSVTVHATTIIENILTADLPQELDDMPEHLRDSFYPYEGRPSVILSDPEGRVQMTFQILQKELRDTDTRKAAQAVHRYTEYFYSGNTLSPVYMNRSGEVPVGWFLMEMELGDMKCHHICRKPAVRIWTGCFRQCCGCMAEMKKRQRMEQMKSECFTDRDSVWN